MKRVFNLLVVDESGSMSIIERQALVGINETLTTIQKMQKTHKDMEQRVTLITFDSTHKNLFYDNVSAHHIKPLKSRDYNPCGGTPLYDAIGMSIAKINALTTEDDSVLVTIITDGEENIAHGLGIDNHLQFSEDEAGTKAMFARENRARERYNKCRAMDCKMEAGSYFGEK